MTAEELLKQNGIYPDNFISMADYLAVVRVVEQLLNK